MKIKLASNEPLNVQKGDGDIIDLSNAAIVGNNGKIPASQIPSYIEKVRTVTVSSNLTNQTTSIGQGESETVVYVNSGNTTNYTIAVSSTYVTPFGDAIELTCPKGGYCEVNYINIGGVIYVRGL